MKKLIFTTVMFFMSIIMVMAAGTAEIKFEKTTHDFGIKPGESGEIIVTYNGAGKFPGKFQKTVTLRTNGKSEITRLIIKGDMMPAAAEVK